MLGVSHVCRVREVLVTRRGRWPDCTVWRTEPLSGSCSSDGIPALASVLQITSSKILQESSGKNHHINSSALTLEDYIAVIIGNNGR